MARREKEPRMARPGSASNSGPVFGGEKDQTPVGRAPVPGKCRVEPKRKNPPKMMERVTRVGRNASTTATVKDIFAAKSAPAARRFFSFQNSSTREWIRSKGERERRRSENTHRPSSLPASREESIEEKFGDRACDPNTRETVPPQRPSAHGTSGIEIHINRKRTGAPDGESGKKGPALPGVLSGEGVRKEQAEETVNGVPRAIARR